MKKERNNTMDSFLNYDKKHRAGRYSNEDVSINKFYSLAIIEYEDMTDKGGVFVDFDKILSSDNFSKNYDNFTFKVNSMKFYKNNSNDTIIIITYRGKEAKNKFLIRLISIKTGKTIIRIATNNYNTVDSYVANANSINNNDVADLLISNSYKTMLNNALDDLNNKELFSSSISMSCVKLFIMKELNKKPSVSDNAKNFVYNVKVGVNKVVEIITNCVSSMFHKAIGLFSKKNNK